MFRLYEIINSVNDKKYIGASSNMIQRKCIHFSEDSKCTKLKKAIEELGKDVFSINVLCIGSKEYILDLENKAISLYNSVDDGYNTYRHNGFFNNEPVYVAGFWFKNARQAITKLNTTSRTYRNWIERGVLGETYKPLKNSVLERAVYFKGFWFSSVILASEKMGLHYKTIDRTIKAGNYEQFNPNCQADRMGFTKTNNPMKGMKGGLCKHSKSVKVGSVVYGSIIEAAKAVGITDCTVRRRIKNNVEGYSYV